MTAYLFKDAKFRSLLINRILDGTLTIDPSVCHCIYRLRRKDDGSQELYTVNLDKNGDPDQCDYDTTLGNLGYTLGQLGRGSYGYIAEACKDEDCNLSYALKVVLYENKRFKGTAIYGEIDDPDRPENLEVRILKILNQRILYPKLSPHIILYIQDFVCQGLPALFPNGVRSDFDLFAQQLRLNNKVTKIPKYDPNHAMVLISEIAKFGSLYHFIITQPDWITEEFLGHMIFQFLITFAQIQRVMPTFRHNDCHSGNLLLAKDDHTDLGYGYYYIYRYEDRFYRLPVIFGQIKLWDFDFANIEGETHNHRLKAPFDPPIGYRATRNHYYDLHLFFNDLLALADPNGRYQRNRLPNIAKDSEVMSFLREAVPLAYYGFNKVDDKGVQILGQGRLVPDEEFTTPHKLLTRHPFILGRYAVDLDQLDMETIIDAFGIDFEELKELIKIASTKTTKIGQLAQEANSH